MKKSIFTLSFLSIILSTAAQYMSPEALVELGKLSVKGISSDGKSVVYSVKRYSNEFKKATVKTYTVPVGGGVSTVITDDKGMLKNNRLSPDGKYSIYSKDVKMMDVSGKDFYSELSKSDAMIYNDLNYRHWDTWEDGAFSHIFIHQESDKDDDADIDINAGESFDCPQKPFGGDEDFIWNNDGKQIIYVTKKKSGKEYALSTNTDIYSYNVETKTTSNLTQGMMGYDLNPAFSKDGVMAWMSMKTDGYEADKQDIIVNNGSFNINLTKGWDGNVENILWSNDGKKIYFNAAVDGTLQLFEIAYPGMEKNIPQVKQITKGDWDISGMIGQVGNTMIVTRTDMNHAAELYFTDLNNGAMKQLTHINDEKYNSLHLGKIEKRYVTTTDNQQMLEWIIYPPDFDATKKYPTLLYCQGGPQSALTQFYSFRWNFQVMAAHGYIVVAPNRRGMPGHGVKWNEAVSKDYGGQVMQDYLTAIDDFSKQPFVDKNRLGCVGASFGGYSVYYLAGIHNHRFKTFIAHDGIFDLKSMYGTTEEMWFVNWDLGGGYWEKDNAAAQKSFATADPMSNVQKWDTPILVIHGGKDYRCPAEQGFEAFQAAQLKGIKSRLLYFPNENHWVLDTQDALVWQHEFFKWLKETL